MAAAEALPVVVAVALAMFVVMFVLRRFHQPHVISYIVVGVLLGPGVLGLIGRGSFLAAVGDLGIMLLLFFVGMHLSLPKLVKGWRVAIIGTLLQVLASVGVAWLLGWLAGWPFPRSLLLGFVISLSSTAVLVKVLEERGELASRTGRDVLSILLVQDVAIVPMLLILGLFAPGERAPSEVYLPLLGGALVVAFLVYLLRKGEIRLLSPKLFRGDHELELVAALILCFGFAFVTGLFHLSTALGAFVAGIMLAAAKETEWVQDHLYPLQLILVALFFVYVGLLLDLAFLAAHWPLVLGLVAAVLLTNTALNAGILRVLGRRWRNAWYGGALLSQIGELSFLLAAVGLSSGVITEYGYQMTLSVIALGLLVTPAWIALVRRWACPELAAKAPYR